MQHLIINQDASGEYQPLYCLKCGTMQDPESSSYCSHVTFVYLPQYDFEYVAPAFVRASQKIKQSVEESDAQGIEEFLLNLPSTGSNFIVEVSSLGMSCGASPFRVLYGFDFCQS